jgi:thioesterase domain-containing protein/acyl carrier protein
MRELLQFSERDRLLSVITISFDPAGIDVWLPLLTGACTVFASREAAADGNALCGLLDRHDITAMQATPMTWRLLFNAGWRGKPNLKAVCGGEVMPPELAAELVSSAKQVWNMYGPTEATVSSTCYEVMNTEEIIPIGRPIANKHCYILDEQGQPVPVGVTGELFIGGDGLARGYLNRPKLTQEKFVPDPFRGGLARMYSTGDLARYRADGNIDCLGRVDHQVKIRGYRTELGEIEAALEDHPTITQVVVIAHTDTHGDKQLVAYIETGAGVALDLRELRNSLKRKLPEYMVPSAYVLLKQLPISPNGKIDRNALPPPDSAKQADRTDARELGPPCNPVEEKIAAIFSRQLGVSAVGATDDFFDLGGHSLKAARSIALLNEEFGTGIPVRVLFQAHTARQLAAVIDRTDKSDEEPWPVLIPIQPRGTRPPLFCVARPSVNALGYLMLSREMGGEQPVFGLQIKLGDDPDMDFAKEQFISTAITYIEAIKTVQPHGPYNLIGECQGTFIAFEMARRLEAAGEEVSLFGVLDTWPEENTRHRSLFHLHVALQGLRMMDRETPLRVIRKFLSKFLLPLMSHSQTNSPAKRAPSGMETLEQRYWPGKDFRQEMCFCPITVFRANEQMWYRIRDEELGWGNRTRGGVTVMRIAGTHPMLLRPPYVQEVAAFLAEELRVASERHALAYGEALAASL